MIGFWLLAVGRIGVIGLALLTWAYALTTYSAFAFDMFVKPRLFPWLDDFVSWHHLWSLVAYAISVATLAPELWSLRRPEGRGRAAAWLALAYALTFGGVALVISTTPYLPALPSRADGLAASLVPLVPLVWLAVIDWAAAAPAIGRAPLMRPAVSLARLCASCGVATGVVWLAHFGHLATGDAAPVATAEWWMAGAWTLALSVNAFLVVFAVASLAVTLGARWRRDGLATFGLSTVAMAIALSEFFRVLVFGSLAFDRASPVWLAAPVGATLAFVWSGLMLRAEAARRRHTGVAFDSLLVSWRGGARGAMVALVCVPAAALWLSGRIEQVDWDFVAHRMVAAVECAVVFGLALGLTSRLGPVRWPLHRYAPVPLAAVLLLYAVPWAAHRASGAGGTHRMPVDALVDRLASADPVFSLLTRGLVRQPRPDDGYFRDVLRSSARSLETPRAVPDVAFALPLGPAPAGRPHVFMFVIDSLRRDYLAPTNPAVQFTPHIAAWARASFVFDNAFTRYGGTWLAIPSIWAGGELPRSWGRMPFPKVNALEKLMTANGYRVVLNDYTVASSLRPDPARTFLDPERGSTGADLCQQVEGLERVLDRADGQPVFAFLAPMNVHMLGTTPAPPDVDARDAYRGFDEAYAAKLQRIDGCFGRFLKYLDATGLADDSIVVLTADHGDSLGEDGRWGHAHTLSPEVVRIPLVIGLPPRIRATVTTDLSRIAFSTDVAPTLYWLLGYEVRNLGPHYGAPLFTSADGELESRRHEPFLLMSSYGATYGLLRRNGRLLYVSDLVGAREFAFDLRGAPLGRRVPLGNGLRTLNQSLIRDRIAGLERIYHPDETVTPHPPR